MTKNTITFRCVPSPDTNDHEAIVVIDNEVLFDEDFMGLDPPKLFEQESILSGGQAIVGRCNCGCEGCSDFFVEIVIEDVDVIWNLPQGSILRFDRNSYETEFYRASTDFSWEDNNRRAERFVSTVISDSKTDIGYKFDWASARIKKKTIVLSFSDRGNQVLFEFKWDGKNPNKARDGALKFVKDLPKLVSESPNE